MKILEKVRIVSVVILIMLALVSFGQDTDFEPCNDPEKWVNKLLDHQSGVTAVKASYTEYKKLKGFKEPQESNGTFFFEPHDKIRLAQVSPQDLIFISDGKNDRLRINQEEITKEARMMVFKQVKKIIAGMFNGDLIEKAKYFEPSYFLNDTQFIVKLIPEDRKVRMYITEIVLKFDQKSMIIAEMVTQEKSGNNSVMKFFDVQENIKLDGSIFSNF